MIPVLKRGVRNGQMKVDMERDDRDGVINSNQWLIQLHNSTNSTFNESRMPSVAKLV